jgi:pimeloyl-ACP methyl ester carboxylesterase
MICTSGWRSRSFSVCLVSALAMVVPAAASVLAPTSAASLEAPPGVGQWRDDPRRLPDPADPTPLAVGRYLRSIGPKAQRSLAERYPGVVGNLDGADPVLRYAANQRAMTLAGTAYTDRPGQYLLFDPRGQGKVAQVFGDLHTAERVAILVPGAGNRADNFWRGVGGKRFRSPSVQGSDLYEAARSDLHDESFAVVVWLGYDAPDRVGLSAAREDLAAAGAAPFERFVSGLVALRPTTSYALLGYSYGSTVIGLAASRLPKQVTDIVALGSPGMGVDHISQLGTSAHVWAALSPRDAMHWIPGFRVLGLGHGIQPADHAFGSTVIPAAEVPDHDHYLAPGSDSLREIASIAAAGRLGPVTP